MIKRGTILGLIGALAAALLLTGCGEDDEPDPKEQYIAQGDEICALGTFQIGAESQKRYGAPQAPPKESKEFSEQVVVPTLRTEVLDKLRALPPPPGDEQTTAAIYDALDQAIDQLAKDPELLAEPGTGGAFDEVNQLAQEYGFQQCGRG